MIVTYVFSRTFGPRDILAVLQLAFHTFSSCWNRPCPTNPARDTRLCGTKAGAGLIHAVVPSMSFRFKTLIFFTGSLSLATSAQSWCVSALSTAGFSFRSRSVRRIRFERTREMSKSKHANPRDFMGRVRVRVIVSGNINYLGTLDQFDTIHIEMSQRLKSLLQLSAMQIVWIPGSSS